MTRVCEICKTKYEPKPGTFYFYDHYFCSEECRQIWVSLPTATGTDSSMFQKWRQKRNTGEDIPLIATGIVKQIRRLIPEYSLFFI